MKKTLLTMLAFVAISLNMQAQPPADSTPTYPQGATYTHSSGTATITDSYSSSTQYYNVTINRNGYTLTTTSTTGSGTINETTGIKSIEAEPADSPAYTLDGRKASEHIKGIIIKNGKKIIR